MSAATIASSDTRGKHSTGSTLAVNSLLVARGAVIVAMKSPPRRSAGND